MNLTPRQHEIVVKRCADDMTTAETAYALGISPNTVRSHSTEILDRLGEKSFQGVCREYGRMLGFRELMAEAPTMRAENV